MRKVTGLILGCVLASMCTGCLATEKNPDGSIVVLRPHTYSSNRMLVVNGDHNAELRLFSGGQPLYERRNGVRYPFVVPPGESLMHDFGWSASGTRRYILIQAYIPGTDNKLDEVILPVDFPVYDNYYFYTDRPGQDELPPIVVESVNPMKVVRALYGY